MQHGMDLYGGNHELRANNVCLWHSHGASQSAPGIILPSLLCLCMQGVPLEKLTGTLQNDILKV